jgi:hypothetical protein
MNELIPVEHKNQRVLTTQQLAEVYETETNNIHKNFSNNESRFIEGEHYHILKGEELQAFKRSLNDIPEPLKYAPSLFLWTEKGASRHCKILDTDMAWKRFDELEETYFRTRVANQIDTSRLSPELQMVQHLLNASAKLEMKVERLESTQQAIREAVIAEPDNWREDTNRKMNNISQAIGENKFQEVRAESYKLLESRAGVNLERRLSNYKTRLLEQGKSVTAINRANKMDVIDEDKKLREIYGKIVSEYYIRYMA